MKGVRAMPICNPSSPKADTTNPFKVTNQAYDAAHYEREAIERKEISQKPKKKGSIWRIEPVDPITFIERYIGTRSLSEKQIAVTRDMFGDNPTKHFFEVEMAILKNGQGSGKNFLMVRLVVYLLYLWCCLEDPHKYFGLAHNEHFDILNFSQVNAQQAKNVFFRALADIIQLTKDPVTGNNWFVQHQDFRIAAFSRGNIKEKELSIPNRNLGFGGIRVYCLDTTAKSVEGYTIWVTILDEPSRANSAATYAVAKHQYMTAYTNQKTRFTNPHHRITIVFSYPEQEVNDLLVELFDLYSKNPKENSHEIIDGILTAWYATYVFNAKDQLLKKEQYLKDHKNDPVDADRRWRAIVPPNVYGFFMPHFGKVNDCANPNLISPVQYKETVNVRSETVKGVLQEVNYAALELTGVKGDNLDRYWGADFATNKDRLVIVGGYAAKTDRPVDEFAYSFRDGTGQEVFKSKVIDCRPVIDIILVWESPKPGWVIDYQNVENIILDLFKNYYPHSRALHFDQWNTESIRQKVLDAGVSNCEKLSFSNPMQLLYGKLVRHLVWNNAIEYLDNAILQREMSQLSLLNNIKLDHQKDGSKDIWDAMMIATNLIMEHGFMGKRMDFDSGEDHDVDAEMDEMLVIFDKAYTNFVDTHSRKPKDTQEMQQWLKTAYKQEWALAEVDMMHHSWSAWASTLNAKMAKLGIRTTGKVSPMAQRHDQDGLMDDIAAQGSTMEEDLEQMEDGGNLIY